jgi:peptidoglycan/xylan/chitin deacetylase (PgdA/CDA1 family)
MTADDLVPLRIRGATGHLAWSEGLTVSLPGSWLEKARLTERIGPPSDLCLPRDLPSFPERSAAELRNLAAWTHAKPVSSRLPFSYQSMPAWLRSLLAGMVGRSQRRRSDTWGRFPRWPLDLSADFLADWAGEPSCRIEGRTPVMLSHDLDSPEGLRNAVEFFLPLEEKWGARSSNYFVPQAWALDHGLLSEIATRGHELGIHGYDHANKTPFLEEEILKQRLEASRPLIERYGIKGYRSPSLLRTPNLLRGLESLYLYDSSIPTSGGLFPVPNNGCASARPFRLGKLAELPLSLPRDGSLRFLGYRPREIADLWISCAGTIARSGGAVVLLTHCEQRFSGNASMLEAYRRFLEYIASDSRYEWAMPVPFLARLGLLNDKNGNP